MSTGQITLLFILGAACGAGLTCWGTNRQIVHLKQAGDSAQAAGQARDSVTTAFADSMLGVVDSLQKAKWSVVVRVRMDSAAARTAAEAVHRATHVSDSVVALVAQVEALESEVSGLQKNARTDSLTLVAALARGNVLQDSLHAQTKTIVGLNAEIQRLNAHRLPKWARIGFAVGRDVLAVKGLSDAIRGTP